MAAPAYGISHIFAELPSQTYRFWTGEGVPGVYINDVEEAGTWTRDDHKISWNGPDLEIENNTGSTKTAKFLAVGWHPTDLNDPQVLLFLMPHGSVELADGNKIIYTGFTITFTTEVVPAA